MLLDASLPPIPLNEVPPIAKAAEEFGFNAIWTTETQHNPFLPCALISDYTSRLNFGTAIAVSFARSPATMAYVAWDLAQASKGRFILGLGTQVRGHIERRFGLSWPESPVGKLREQIQAIRAFWNTWQTGERLNFRGVYYKLNLMSPFFNPGPLNNPDIPIYIAGVNTGLAQLAGEVADGFHVHPFHSPDYLNQVLRPAISEGAEKTGRTIADCSISTSVFVFTNDVDREFVRQQISFYASTPTYRSVMALHGWGDTAQGLSRLAARGEWEAMPKLITDEMMETFAVHAVPADLAKALKKRYTGLADRLTPYLPFIPGQRDDFWKSLTNQFGE